MSASGVQLTCFFPVWRHLLTGGRPAWFGIALSCQLQVSNWPVSFLFDGISWQAAWRHDFVCWKHLLCGSGFQLICVLSACKPVTGAMTWSRYCLVTYQHVAPEKYVRPDYLRYVHVIVDWNVMVGIVRSEVIVVVSVFWFNIFSISELQLQYFNGKIMLNPSSFLCWLLLRLASCFCATWCNFLQASQPLQE